MSQENRKSPGRKKGCEKTGGRKKGSLNKKNRRLRQLFEERGFDYVKEVMESIQTIGANPLSHVKLDYLVKLAPYFMQRLRQEEEILPGESPLELPDESQISTQDLLKLAGVK